MGLQAKQLLDTDPTPILVFTDDGRDVDDVEALAYFTGASETEVVGIVTSHMIPDRRALIARAFMGHLGRPNVPIGVGSIFPMGKEDTPLITYLREHTIDGRTYEGDGLIECFPSAEEIIVGATTRYGRRLKIAALTPLTDLAKAVRDHRDLLSGIGGVYIQGQASVEGGWLSPDPQAYNLQEDMEAATTVMDLQDDVPFTFVGKHAAYTMPLGRAEFNAFEATGNPAGIYLKNHAVKGIQCFAERSPDIFQRVFGVDPSRVDELDELSKPYDALVAMAIARPELFTPVHIGQHALIGVSKENPGVKDPTRVKEILVTTILRGLTA